VGIRLLRHGRPLALGAAVLLVTLSPAAELPQHAGGAAPAIADQALDALTLADLETGHAQARWTSEQLTERYLARIDALDRHGPHLAAVLEVQPGARREARRLDRERRAGHVRGLLHGAPILLKDNIDTGAGLRMHTTAGSLALMDSAPREDAFIVRRLRAAGALILGKTNLSEWADYRSKHASSGWSGRGGQTRNPFVLDRNPCGSSSGSAVAVAADLALAAVGTETDGSIVCPASVNGLVGIKPTLGLVSRSGIIPIAASQDTAGPIARTVADAAALLNVLAGYDPDDPATLPLKDRTPPDFRLALHSDALKGVRVGVLRDYAGFQDDVDAHFEHAIDTLRSLGAVIVDPVSVPTRGKFDDDEQTVLRYEFKDGINRYLATRNGAGAGDLTALIAFNATHRAEEMTWFGQDIFLDAQRAGPPSDAAYIDARERAKRLAGPEGIDAALNADHLDVLVAPTVGPAWLTDLINGDHAIGGDVTSPPAVAGYPHITVPMEPVHGLPVGLSFVGTAWSDAALIGYAYAYEQATHFRRPPHFLPHLNESCLAPCPSAH
jgi:amidase